ncbi:MAG: C-terminal binding protein [Spirochaetes bacterium]|nr:MAG: C-terminal binding protein [Spirochaetota bacterium]
MKKYKVAVTDDRYESYKEENEVLSELGITVEVHNFTNAEEAKAVLKDADAVLVNLFPLTKDIIDSMESCRVIVRYGVGYDNVDVDAATAKGIWMSRVPDYSLEDVSDHALALLLSSVRKIAYKDRQVRSGKWNLHKDWPAFRIAGKTLGLVGFGAISRVLYRKVAGLGLDKVLIYDPYVPAADIKKLGGTPAGLNEVVSQSDFISIHAPLTKETEGIIGSKEFAAMKENCILVNTSRGPLINEEALYQALKSGRIAAAGIDVFNSEPLIASSPLRSLENITLTDHAGWYSEESIVELKTKVARNVLSVLKGGKPVYPVNEVK